ncbi:FolB domain-containing protein [Candidatus Schneideria nysicola]|uniref:FolB domain-containing protein n=1 Tax=Candidatus Schneideria nysicola TaxID=1081631 RepID=UPI001CAA4BBE|nr:FolB domain-containing protein [Candidatus Schneideria nysicola]UAJ65113.1 FolB domain-containing protein [Candidatus Schneideria nysicola]UAJ65646.1 FolB domain-containing protein [Candidatus Schneideria nysicola]UAJ66174.1 FolB domain-containing protein [Candidatus Schneideria nysicola]
MDILFIEKLNVITFIGIYKWEKERKQKLVLDIEIGISIDNHQLNQNNYINYIDISNTILKFFKDKKFDLIENIAEKIAYLLITQFNLPWIRIKISKPGAIAQSSNVGIIIERVKKDFS